MKKRHLILLTCLLLSLLAIPVAVSAQNYSFEVFAMEVEAYIEEDGMLSVWYQMEFHNRPGAAPIDFVDIGMPSPNYSLNNIEANIDGVPILQIEDSPYVPNGFALGLGDEAIPPGEIGTVSVWITGVKGVLTPYDFGDRENYINFQFSPTWFDPQFDRSANTEYRVTIILPPGVGDEEGVYYDPENWPGSSTPGDIGRTEAENRIFYSWFSNSAVTHTQYIFGAAFPDQYVPEDAVTDEIPQIISPGPADPSPTFIQRITSAIGGDICCFGFGLFFLAIFGWSMYQGTVGANKRKMQYLPPKMKIEGNGIKRGLTAVEAAILMEQPMDKIFTMILFGALKKEAATVIKQDPLELEVTEPLPEGLHPYEEEFLEAFKLEGAKKRTALQKMMVELVNSVSKKMKGFSLKETVAYYQDIMRRAWKMVEEADTPEVKSEHYNQTLEWTMLDDQYQERTRRTFSGGPVFVPIWWPRYSPSYRRTMGTGTGTVRSAPVSGKPAPGGGPSLPTIPGSNFAAGLINGVTGMAAGVVGNLTSFTTGVTNRTNPIPQSSRSGSGGFRGGGGSSCACACACACAGCACACAGGGR